MAVKGKQTDIKLVELQDCPTSYTGDIGKFLIVNATEDGIIFHKQQYNLNWVILGHTASGDIKGIDCDYDESDILDDHVFSNCHLFIKGSNGSDYTPVGTPQHPLLLDGIIIVEQSYDSIISLASVSNNSFVFFVPATGISEISCTGTCNLVNCNSLSVKLHRIIFKIVIP